MKRTVGLSLGALLVLSLSACGKKTQTQAVKPSPDQSSQELRSTPAVSSSSTSTSNFGLRQCTHPVTHLVSSDFEEFTHTKVINLEGEVTVCLNSSGSGNSQRMRLRMEWEDNIGVRYYPDNFAGASYSKDKLQLVSADLNPAATEIFFMDIEGFVAIRGSVTAGMLQAHIDYVDIVPFLRDPSGEPIFDVNGIAQTQFTWGPHNQCRSNEYKDIANIHLPGFYQLAGMANPEECISSFNIPHSLYGFNFNLVPGDFTPTIMSASWSDLEKDNLIGMIRSFLDPANKVALEALNVRQGSFGDIEVPAP